MKVSTLHRSGPLFENGFDKPENFYGRYGFASFSRISMSTIGVEPEFPPEDYYISCSLGGGRYFAVTPLIWARFLHVVCFSPEVSKNGPNKSA